MTNWWDCMFRRESHIIVHFEKDLCWFFQGYHQITCCCIHFNTDFRSSHIATDERLAWGRSKSGSTLSQSEGQILIDIMNDHGLEQMVHFPTREKKTLDLILTTLPGQFKDVHSPDKLSDHDIVSGTLKIFIPPIKKPRRKVIMNLWEKILLSLQ